MMKRNPVAYLCVGVKCNGLGKVTSLTHLVLVRMDLKRRTCLDIGRSMEELLVAMKDLKVYRADCWYRDIPVMNYGHLNLKKNIEGECESECIGEFYELFPCRINYDKRNNMIHTIKVDENKTIIESIERVSQQSDIPFLFDPIWFWQDKKINFYSASGIDLKNENCFAYYFYQASDSLFQGCELLRVIGRFYKPLSRYRWNEKDGVQYVVLEYIPTGECFAVDEPDFSAILTGQRKDEITICLNREYDYYSARIWLSKNGITLQNDCGSCDEYWQRRRFLKKKNWIKIV